MDSLAAGVYVKEVTIDLVPYMATCADVSPSPYFLCTFTPKSHLMVEVTELIVPILSSLLPAAFLVALIAGISFIVLVRYRSKVFYHCTLF